MYPADGRLAPEALKLMDRSPLLKNKEIRSYKKRGPCEKSLYMKWEGCRQTGIGLSVENATPLPTIF